MALLAPRRRREVLYRSDTATRRGEEGPAAGLRARLEPHDAARAAGRSDDHLSAGALPVPRPVASVREDDGHLRRRGARPSRIHPLRRQHRLLPACRSSATPARSGSTRSSGIHEDNGCPIFNPHRYTLEEGGMKQTDEVQLAFKREADPEGPAQPRQDDRLGESRLRLEDQQDLPLPRPPAGRGVGRRCASSSSSPTRSRPATAPRSTRRWSRS